MTNLKWWGYRHINWSYQVKRYWDMEDFMQCREECLESWFVEISTTYPFSAIDREDALEKVKSIIW